MKSTIDLLLHEKSQLEERLRDLDRSLLQLAFAFIAGLALSVPALLNNDIIVEDKVIIALIVTSQIIFLGTFFAIMITRSRNITLVHISVLSNKLNELRHKLLEPPILFKYSFEISDFTRFNRFLWFFSYFIPCLILFGGYVISAIYIAFYFWSHNQKICLVVIIIFILEIFTMFIYVHLWNSSRSDKNIKKIEQQWSAFENNK